MSIIGRACIPTPEAYGLVEVSAPLCVEVSWDSAEALGDTMTSLVLGPIELLAPSQRC